jgi:NTE family protein
VLGSGGARGLAHIGVIRALEENGQFGIRSITGTSIGALIGGLYAGGKLDIYADWVSKLSRSDVWGLLDFSFTNKGLFKGERVMKKLADLVGEAQIEDLDIPFTAVASDIERRQEIWISEGSLFEAIRASIAIPGLFTPVERKGRILVDGGLLSPLPLAPAQYHRVEQSIVVSLNGIPIEAVNETESKAGDRDHDAAEDDDNVLRRWLERA